jgi:hypothetical protein
MIGFIVSFLISLFGLLMMLFVEAITGAVFEAIGFLTFLYFFLPFGFSQCVSKTE